MGSECGIPASKAGLATLKEAGAVKELVLEANTKVMAFVDQPLDPLFETNDLKDGTNGVYSEVFEGFSYDSMIPPRGCRDPAGRHGVCWLHLLSPPNACGCNRQI